MFQFRAAPLTVLYAYLLYGHKWSAGIFNQDGIIARGDGSLEIADIDVDSRRLEGADNAEREVGGNEE